MFSTRTLIKDPSAFDAEPCHRTLGETVGLRAGTLPESLERDAPELVTAFARLRNCGARGSVPQSKGTVGDTEQDTEVANTSVCEASQPELENGSLSYFISKRERPSRYTVRSLGWSEYSVLSLPGMLQSSPSEVRRYISALIDFDYEWTPRAVRHSLLVPYLEQARQKFCRSVWVDEALEVESAAVRTRSKSPPLGTRTVLGLLMLHSSADLQALLQARTRSPQCAVNCRGQFLISPGSFGPLRRFFTPECFMGPRPPGTLPWLVSVVTPTRTSAGFFCVEGFLLCTRVRFLGEPHDSR